MVSLDNENQLLLQEDALISCRRVSIDSHPQILSWLTVHLQPLMAHSIALKMAFPQQMYQVASTALTDVWLSVIYNGPPSTKGST